MFTLRDKTSADWVYVGPIIPSQSAATLQLSYSEQIGRFIVMGKAIQWSEVRNYMGGQEEAARVSTSSETHRYLPSLSETSQDPPSPVEMPLAISRFLLELSLWDEIDAAAALGSQVEEEIVPPTSEAVAAARSFVSSLLNKVPKDVVRLDPYEVASLPNEGIEMVWKLGNRRLDIVFDYSGTIALLFVEETGGLPRMEEEHEVSVERALARLWSVLR